MHSHFIFTFALFIHSSFASADLTKRGYQESLCWTSKFFRGVGQPISSCSDGMERSGLLCYPKCESNYTGIGPVCWKGMHPKGRGFGHIMNCNSTLENSGGFCYRPCPPNYYGDGPTVIIILIEVS
jgi:hypothetical protein